MKYCWPSSFRCVFSKTVKKTFVGGHLCSCDKLFLAPCLWPSDSMELLTRHDVEKRIHPMCLFEDAANWPVPVCPHPGTFTLPCTTSLCILHSAELETCSSRSTQPEQIYLVERASKIHCCPLIIHRFYLHVHLVICVWEVFILKFRLFLLN